MEIVEKLGKIAGIAGISLGILLIIFREVIRKSVFPTLTKAHGFRLLRLIIILTWSIAVIGLLSWLYIYEKTETKEQDNYEPLKLEKSEKSDSTK